MTTGGRGGRTRGGLTANTTLTTVTKTTTTSTAIQIPCCLCGTMILPNAANQCGACLAQQVDLKSILQRGPGGAPDISIYQCRRCRRYEHSENSKLYEPYEPESPELLALCLRRIPALGHTRGGNAGGEHMAQIMHNVQAIHLVDAMWVWTEPHSMRMRVRLTVRAEVHESPRTVMVQQRVMVELVVKFKMCPDCNREFTNRTWHAVVQLRQKRTDGAPRKGLLMLEMALAKNAKARKHVLRMDTTRHGFDFYFLSYVHAQTFVQYLQRIVPMKIKTTKKMVSSDVKNNTANMKYTLTCDMVPLCRDDLVIVARGGGSSGTGGGGDVGSSGSGFHLSGRLCLVNKVSSVVQLVDATPARKGGIPDMAFADLHPDRYWRTGGEKTYRILMNPRRLVRFVVLDVELCEDEDWQRGGGCGGGNNNNSGSRGKREKEIYRGPQSGVEKYALADVEVAREVDLGSNDETFRCVTHLGNLLQVGDVVLGYDLASSVLPSDAEWSIENSLHSHFVLPDVVLVKKVKGNGSGDGDDGADEGGSKSAERGISGMTKRKERRRRKHEKKQRALEEAAARMGFLDDLVDEEAALEEEKAAFERELENDPELARELDMAEQELSKDTEKIDDGEGDDEEASADQYDEDENAEEEIDSHLVQGTE